MAVRLSSLGDVILTFPFVNEIKRLYPDSKLSFLVKPAYAGAARMHPGIDEVIEYTEDIKNSISGAGFDVIFDLQKNQRTYSLLRSAGTAVYRVKKDSAKKVILASFKVNLLKTFKPVYERYLTALKKYNTDARTVYTQTPDMKCGQNRYAGEKYILVSPSSKHYTKRYPAEKFHELLKDVKTKIILTGDANETDMNVCAYLEKNLIGAVNLCGESDIADLAGLIKGAELVICNDSGVLHIAEALGKRTFVFFGSTVKEFGFYPQLESTTVLEDNDVKCRPCTHIGRADCPKKHFKCMNEIDTSPLKNELQKYK